MNTILAPVTPVLMLVDDEEGERIAIGEFLTELGYRVLHVDHPLLAVEQARDSLPDMIIIKAAMAQIDGCCLCTELHSSLQTQNIPVLMYSKEYDEDLVKRSFEAGAADYLTGPTLYWSMLRNRIKQLLKLQRTEHELDFLSRIFETTNEGIIITDANKAILKVNSGFCRATGYEENEVIGKNPGILKSGRQDKDFYTVMWDTIDNTGQWEGELWNKGKNGSLYAEWLNISAIHDANGKLTNYVGIFSDISAVESKHEHISHLAYHDHLTGLPNRLLLEERLSQAILNAGRAATKLGIMYIDIDNFKPVNDQFGHHAGDQLLREISERLKACVRQSDTLARIGGDEFMILLSHLVDSESSRLVAEKILKSLSMPFIIENTEINVGCSLGISLYPDNGNDMNALIQRADQAMYVSKQNNSPGYMFYSA